MANVLPREKRIAVLHHFVEGNPLATAAPAESPAVLLDVQAVAAMLGCSTRHVYRLADGGRNPRPVKLGALVRWNRALIEQWIAAGCQPVRSVAAARR